MSQNRQSLRLICPNTTDILAKLRRRLPKNYPLNIVKDSPVAAQLLDTETDALWCSGVVLLRANHHLLAITSHRTHWMDIGNQPLVFINDIAPGPLRDELGAVPTLRSLRPRLNVSWKRSAAKLHDDNSICALNIDVITLSTAHGRTHLLDLQSSSHHQKLQHLVTGQLLKIGAFPCSNDEPKQSSFDIVRTLLPAYHGTGYSSNPGVILTPAMTVKQAATAMIGTYINVARHNEAGIIADLDTEYLHDYRVSLRRIRSIITLFKGAYEEQQQQTLKNRFSELMRQTNRLRDLDVYLLEQQDDFNALPCALHKGLSEVFAAFAVERQTQWQSLAAQLSSRSYRLEMRSLQRSFAWEEQLQEGARAGVNCRHQSAQLITRRYRKVCKIAAEINDQTPDHQVHELRLQCKKLRYLLDLCGPLFQRKQVRKIIKSLKRLQDNLGRFNDYSVRQVALQQFLDEQLKLTPDTSPQMIEAVGALIAVKHQLQTKERSLVMQHFAEFHVPATDELFDTLFGVHRKKKPDRP